MPSVPPAQNPQSGWHRAPPGAGRRRALRRVAAGAVALGLLGCAAQRDHADGMADMAQGKREEGLALLAKASQAEPSNSQYRLDFLQQQSLAERDALTRGDEARRLGRLDDARQWYQLALRINPGSDRALRGVNNVEMDARHATVLVEVTGLMNAAKFDEAHEMLHKVLLENSGNGAAQKLWTALAEKQEAAEQAKQAQIRAASVMKKPVSLQFRDANLRLVFEALSRTTGLNVIFDRDVKADLKTTIFVRDASVEDTVDMILLQSQLEKKVLNSNTLFIYPSTAAKQKEYQDLKIRVFQLSNIDGKTMQSELKAVLKSADLSLDEKTNTLVVRGTPDMIGVAEKLVAAHDLPDPEVMLEVEVLEVSRDRLTNLGIQWPSTLAVGTPSSDTTLSNLNHQTLSGLTVNGLSATLNLLLTDTDSNILASPRIRVRDKQKAKILIGSKEPVFTNSVTPTATTSVVTGTITYLDVGIKLEVEPHVYLEGDVGIIMNIEVSNIINQVKDPQSNSLAYEIGTRSAQTSLRLRDGETQILAGLIQDQTRSTTNSVPGLGQIPLFGHLFGNDNRDHSKDEIVLSITPHVLRAPAIADRRVREIFSGTESTVRENPLRLDPVGAVSNSQAGVPPAPAAIVPGFVGGGGNPTPGGAEVPGVLDSRAAPPRHQRPPAGMPWPPGNGPAQPEPGEAPAVPEARPDGEPAHAPAPAPTAAPVAPAAVPPPAPAAGPVNPN